MSLEQILDHINKKAKQKAGHILNDAKKKAEQEMRQTMDEAQLQKESILQQARQKAQERKKRMLQMAYLSGRKKILEEKQKFINFVFNAAINHLAGLNPAKYKQMIRHMLLKAVKSGKEEIILSVKDKKILDKDWLKGINKDIAREKGLPGELRFSQETRDIKGGFILKEGKVEINSSFEAILKYNQNELELKMAEILFGKQT